MRHSCENRSLTQLRSQVRAWQSHVQAFGLEERQRFAEWLAGTLSPREFALVIDSEIDRDSLWEVYLRERYGP